MQQSAHPIKQLLTLSSFDLLCGASASHPYRARWRMVLSAMLGNETGYWRLTASPLVVLVEVPLVLVLISTKYRTKLTFLMSELYPTTPVAGVVATS